MSVPFDRVMTRLLRQPPLVELGVAKEADWLGESIPCVGRALGPGLEAGKGAKRFTHVRYVRELANVERGCTQNGSNSMKKQESYWEVLANTLLTGNVKQLHYATNYGCRLASIANKRSWSGLNLVYSLFVSCMGGANGVGGGSKTRDQLSAVHMTSPPW